MYNGREEKCVSLEDGTGVAKPKAAAGIKTPAVSHSPSRMFFS